jgi:hypothetical protein
MQSKGTTVVGNCDAIQKHINEHCLRMTTHQKKISELRCPMSKIIIIIILNQFIIKN